MSYDNIKSNTLVSVLYIKLSTTHCILLWRCFIKEGAVIQYAPVLQNMYIFVKVIYLSF